MSLLQYDEIYEICCEYRALDEMEKTDKGKRDLLEVMNDRHPVEYKWWENATGEIEKERERELQHV